MSRARWTPTCSGRRGFSLIELLVVICLIMILLGMALVIPRGMKRAPPVMQAAQELAQAFRQARALAIEQQAPVAITFNIQNAPGTDGSMLNNWSGGHWYQMVRSYPMVAGPESSGFMATQGLPEGCLARLSNKMLVDFGRSRDTPASAAVDRTRSCYVGDRVILPVRQVRFIALTDQDNGGAQYSGNALDPNGLASWWGASYPRPWFGCWDPATKRLQAWGGYDHERRLEKRDYTCIERKPGGELISPSGFWYEGHDGAITGCTHPRDRWIASDVQGDDGVFQVFAGDTRVPQDAPLTFADRFFEQGKPRALINGDWMDYSIEFHPDGTVRQGVFEGLRMAYSHGAAWDTSFFFSPDLANAPRPDGVPGAATPPWDLTHIGPGDMCAAQMAAFWTRAYTNHTPPYGPWLDRTACDSSMWAASASSYVDRTGWMWITLAPDAEQKDNAFASAGEAYRSLKPSVRVGVNRYGDVRVVPVGALMPQDLAQFYTLDSELTGAEWENQALMQPRYKKNMRTDVAGNPLGVPAQTFLTQEMLEKRTWWLIPR